MNKKIEIGIITVNDPKNYGNRLQNYALQQVLRDYGTVSTVNQFLNVNRPVEIIEKRLFARLRPVLNRFLSLMPSERSLDFKRLCRSDAFTRRYVPCSQLYASTCLTANNIASLKTVVVGSDQVWNDRWISGRVLSARLADMTNDKTRLISYAASFGINQVKDESKPIFKKQLARFSAISVREDQGVTLVNELSGKPATVVLDPTLMVPAEHWRSITRGFAPRDDKYVLTYFLGRPSAEQERTIQEYAKKHGCRVRRMIDPRDSETYVAGPEDFVELFSKAEYVFADSYHACCFSILFHRQFTVFNRAGTEGKASMNSRMETLFRLFELDSVMLDDGIAPEIDYEKVDLLVRQHRAESKAWLDKAMEV